MYSKVSSVMWTIRFVIDNKAEIILDQNYFSNQEKHQEL